MNKKYTIQTKWISKSNRHSYCEREDVCVCVCVCITSAQPQRFTASYLRSIFHCLHLICISLFYIRVCCARLFMYRFSIFLNRTFLISRWPICAFIPSLPLAIMPKTLCRSAIRIDNCAHKTQTTHQIKRELTPKKMLREKLFINLSLAGTVCASKYTRAICWWKRNNTQYTDTRTQTHQWKMHTEAKHTLCVMWQWQQYTWSVNKNLRRNRMKDIERKYPSSAVYMCCAERGASEAAAAATTTSPKNVQCRKYDIAIIIEEIIIIYWD